MLDALLVTFREGLESFLIVAVMGTYLRKTGRSGLVRGIHIGLALSVLTCLLGAWLWRTVPNQPLYEGIAALAAAGLVGGFLWQMARVGRELQGRIEAQIERVAGDARDRPRGGVAGVALVTALLVTREGLEALFFLGVKAFYARAADLAAGAAAGVVLAAGVALAWARHSSRLHIGIVLRVTAVFLAVFLLQLVVYGVHELAESGIIAGSQGFHDATERFGPDGSVGHLLSYSLAAAPLVYLLLARAQRSQGRAA